MGKKALQYVDIQVDSYVKMMCSYIHGTTLQDLRGRLSTCLNVSDRASVFMDFMCAMGSSILRYYDGVPVRRGASDIMAGVYAFGGKVWEQVDGVKFKIALKEFSLKSLGMSTQEWLKGCERYVQSIHDGALLSPLCVSKSIVGFANGVYDFTNLSNVVYHPFTDKMPVTELLDYDYDIKASCPLWMSFLSSVLDKRQIAVLQKFLSLGLVDRETMEHKIENSLWLVGPGGVGKSTILDTITAVYGRNNISSSSMNDLLAANTVTRPMIIGSIVGKVFNMCGEAQVSNMTGGKADGFKSLCSGEAQPVRRIGRDYELRSDIPYMVFSMNRKPRLASIDGAITRRIVFVTFRTILREEDRDPELGHKLLSELSGIRNWLMRGYYMLVEDGYRFDSISRGVEESDAWLAENGQTVTLFMNKMDCRPYAYSGQKESSRWFPVKILFDRYEKFCDKWGYEKDADLNGMGRELRKIGFASKRTSAGIVYQVYGGDKIV